LVEPVNSIADPAIDAQPDLALGAKVAGLRSAKDANQGSLLRNLAILAGSLVLTALTYVKAVLSAGGGTYFVAFGAAIYGGGYAAMAASRYSKAARALAVLEQQHGSEVIDTAVAAWADGVLAGPGGTLPSGDADVTAGTSIGLGASVGQPGTSRTVGVIMFAFAAVCVLFPVWIFASPGGAGSLSDSLGSGLAIALLAVDICVAIAAGYMGWRLITQRR
jgi:hypothetical protein